MTEVRIDKWMWATRIFKTRTIAVEACKKGRVSIKGVTVKPSRMVKINDIIEVRKPPIIYSFEVVSLIDKRVGAKVATEYIRNVTPQNQLDVLDQIRISGFVDRAKGTGRPTKKERRSLEDFTDADADNFEFDFDFEE